MCDIDKSKFGANEAELAIIMRDRGQSSRAHLVDFYAVDDYSNDDGEYKLITMELGKQNVFANIRYFARRVFLDIVIQMYLIQ